jgi:hypothetical protein
MNSNENAKIEKMIIELTTYIEQLSATLQNGCHDEMCKAKEKYKEVITLAGELDAYFTK